MRNFSDTDQASVASFRRMWRLFPLLPVALIFLMPSASQAQSEIKTPHMGELSCARILRLQQQGVIGLYERRYGESETKWAMADYNRCKDNDNQQAARRLPSATQNSIASLRKYLEGYFSAQYAMMTIEVGSGNPFELDELDSQSAIEDLIGKAIIIYFGAFSQAISMRSRVPSSRRPLPLVLVT